MLVDFGFQELSPVGVEARQRAFFVSAHEPAVTDNIAGKDGA